MIYLISGLGADQRVFSKLNFGNLPTVFLPWIVPKKNESLENYLFRFSEPIDTKNEIILIGVSFGGMMAVELSKILPAKKTIIISSIKCNSEFSTLLKILKSTKLYKLLPSSRLRKNFNFLPRYYFGAETHEEKKALDELISDSDDRIIDWSVKTVMNWKNDQVPENLFHIHGTHDRIFPFHYLHDVIPVENGTHLMITNKAGEVSSIIQQLLNNS